MAWERVCRFDDVPEGTLREIAVDTRRIFVARVGGQWSAADTACPHAGCSLGEGALQGPVLTCVCHGAQFDVRTGQVLRPPARRGLVLLPIELRNGEVYVEF